MQDAIQNIVAIALAEDIGEGDVTSKLTVPESATLKGNLVARQQIAVAGLAVAAETFKQVNKDCVFEIHVKDGDVVEPGTSIATISGPARSVLTGERTALNFLQMLSGIATLTRTYVDAIAGTNATLLDTRKTTPGLRALSKYAVTMGGGKNHRMRLDDGILIKDNHLALRPDLKAVIKDAKENYTIPVEVECDTAAQVDEAVAAGADIVLLDNMTPEMIRDIVNKHRDKIKFEASGGIRLDNIHSYAETGVDYISVGRLTQSAPAVDIGLDYSD